MTRTSLFMEENEQPHINWDPAIMQIDKKSSDENRIKVPVMFAMMSFYFPPTQSICMYIGPYRVSQTVPQLSETEYIGRAWICHYLGIRILTHSQS